MVKQALFQYSGFSTASKKSKNGQLSAVFNTIRMPNLKLSGPSNFKSLIPFNAV